MSNFNQGTPTVPSIVSASNIFLVGNTTSGTALSVQQLGAGGAVASFSNATGASLVSINSACQLVPTGSGAVATNTAVGQAALQNNTTGNNNTAVGQAAMQANTTGNNNTAVGTSALLNNTTGQLNTAVGKGAMQNNTTGYNNTAVGASAMTTNTGGYQNTAVGNAAMQNNTTGNLNTAVGQGAMQANTIGIQNTAVGTSALMASTIGNYNTAIGMNAMFTNTTGGQNTAVGAGALAYNTTGYNTTAVGAGALVLNTTGFTNTAVGQAAMYTNTIGYLNTAVGANALYTNVSGFANSAVGVNALYTNTTGNYNVAMGYNALYWGTNNIYNTAIGYRAMEGASGSAGSVGNVAVGIQALLNNTTGNYNVALGINAMNPCTTGTYNIGIGADSMATNTTGSNNTAVGRGAGPSVDGLTNTTCIGNGATTSISNALILGNNSVNVGIGVSSPSYILSVTGTPAAATGRIMDLSAYMGGTPGTGECVARIYYADAGISESGVRIGVKSVGLPGNVSYPFQAYVNGTAVMSVTTAGAVGIGSTNPGSALAVYGVQSGRQLLSIGDTLGYSTAGSIFGLSILNTAGGSVMQMGTGANGTTTSQFLSYNSTGTAATDYYAITQYGYYTGSGFVQTGANNVGIGITNPTKPLVVKRPGSGGANPAIMVANNGGGQGPRIQTYDLTAAPNAWMGLGTDMSGSSYEHSLYFPYGDAGSGRCTVGYYDGTTYSTRAYILTSSTNWVSVSDARAKDILEPISNVTARLETLVPVVYTLKADTIKTPHLGLIAQEVQKVFPEAVEVPQKPEDMLGVNYTELVPVLVEAIKELSARVKFLETKFSA